jgi:excisionase family DNA binding protein
MSDIARALVAELDDDALDRLAEMLAPRILARLDALQFPAHGFPASAAPEALLTCGQAAERAGVHVETIRRAARSGALPAARAGRVVRISPADLSAWLEDARKPVAVGSSRRRRPRTGRTLADALATTTL